MTDEASDEPVEAKDKTLTWAPLLGALAVGGVFVAIIVFAGSGKDTHLGSATDSTGALSCPKTYEVSSKAWVPINPSGIDGKKDLVPDTKPGHATICHYPTSGSPTNRGDARLDGHRTLAGNLTAVTHGLTKLPKGKAAACTSTQPVTGGSYLLGLTFATGVEWVSAPGDECQGSTNGEYDTASIRASLRSAYDARAWVG